MATGDAMISSSFSLFLLRDLPFARFDFPRWQAWAALIVIGLLVGLDPSMRAGTPEMPGIRCRSRWPSMSR
jgi:hypothetical protein